MGHWFAATWPGFSGVVTGMSDRGFAVALNAVELHEPATLTGYPVLLMLRRVLEDARDYDHAVTILTDTKLLASCLLTVVGVHNHQRVVIERGPTKAALRRPDGDAPLIATNDLGTDYFSAPGDHTLTVTSPAGESVLLASPQGIGDSIQIRSGDIIGVTGTTYGTAGYSLALGDAIDEPGDTGEPDTGEPDSGDPDTGDPDSREPDVEPDTGGTGGSGQPTLSPDGDAACGCSAGGGAGGLVWVAGLLLIGARRRFAGG